MEQIEHLTAGLVARHVGPDHNTTGFFIHVDDSAVRPGRPCTLQAEVTEVTPTEAMFKVNVIDESSGIVIGTADYSRVIVAPPYQLKL
jgi:predicted thioesterase